MHNSLKIAAEIIKSQFCSISSQSVIDRLYQKEKTDELKQEQVLLLLRRPFRDYNEDVLSRHIDALFRKIRKQLYDDRIDHVRVMDVLVWFAVNMITFNHDRYLYRYAYTDIWRSLIQKVDEEIIVTAAVARRDLYQNYKRVRYDWPLCIEHDNHEIANILNRDIGTSENHFHLRGSSPYVHLSWIHLMNRVKEPEYRKRLMAIEKDRLADPPEYYRTQSDVSLALMWKRAAAIRVFLYGQYKKKCVDFGSYYLSREEMEQDLASCSVEMDEFFVDGSDLVLLVDVQYVYYAHGLAEQYQKRWDACAWQALLKLLSVTEEAMFPIWRLQRAINTVHACSASLDYAKARPTASYARYENILGERCLLYHVSKKAMEDIRYANLLHAYLIMKNTLRNELVQSNQIKGFVNFQKFQNRKDAFIYPWSEHIEYVLALATVESLLQGPKIFRVEFRIAPYADWKMIAKNIRLYDAAIEKALENYHQVNKGLLLSSGTNKKVFNHYYQQNKGDLYSSEEKLPKYYKEQFFYTLHFIKDTEKDNANSKNGIPVCRHAKLRKELKDQMRAILTLRHRNPEIARRIRGIDAANKEMDCRPEVFASVFRRLLYEQPSENLLLYVKTLKATYHVAEDNYDIADALRAVDEAIRFLGLRSGCRLGHATLLGSDVRRYYQKHDFHAAMPKQVLLDNFVWMYYFIMEHNIRFEGVSLANSYFLERAKSLFREIYKDNLLEDELKFMLEKVNRQPIKDDYAFDIASYYDAWKLRGDDPDMYANGYYQPHGFSHFDANELDLSLQEIRKRTEPAYLYYMYHYNEKVKQIGSETADEPLPEYVINAISAIQKAMKRKILRLGISIETNPSSNLLISDIPDYGNHPIVDFYHKDMQKEADETQLHVSVNTDDKTIFSTNLSNEYALLAFYLQEKKDDADNPIFQQYAIYDWVDSIRKMGNEQSFGYEMEQGYPC